MRFDYYERLSAKDQRIYRESDAIAEVPLRDLPNLRRMTRVVERALESEDRAAVQRACQQLVRAMTRQLGVFPLQVKVRSLRPKDETGELHGLYTSDGKDVQIEVWMRTAEHRRVVSFRTFMRTLLHEVCHHLDLTHFGLADTFHTEGFFRRESSLMRQLSPAKPKPNKKTTQQKPARPKRAAKKASGAGRKKSPTKKPAGAKRQLSLFS